MINIQEKVDVTKSREFTGNQMSIDPEFFNKMICLVIKQYKYKVRTSLQELISNAQDAQVEAGNGDRKLKITLPTKLEPTFKLRDFGTGMTPDVINKIYCNMGASGSSHTNAKKGGFGIGGKSPLGFCDQYNIKTYVDGTFWYYAVYKNELNGINVDLVHTGDTTEENGTEIIIPSKRDQLEQFKNGAVRATYFWDNQPIFNFEMPKRPKGIKISDKFTVYNGREFASNLGLSSSYYSAQGIVILVDGIPYLVESDMLRQCDELKKADNILSSNSVLVYKIGNGELKVLQTRESLEECEYTFNRLNKIGLDIQKEFKRYSNELLKPTIIDTYKAYKEAIELFTGLPSIDFNAHVKINRNGIMYLNDLTKQDNFLFEAVEYHYRSQRYRQVLTNSKRENKTFQQLPLDKLNSFYLDDIGDTESEQMKARRCKHFIEPSKGEITYIKKTDMPTELYNLLLNELELNVISSLPLPPKKAKTKNTSTKKTLDKGKIDIHIVERSTAWGSNAYVRNCRTIDLNKNLDNKILWCDYSTSTMYDARDYVDFFKSKGFLFGFVSKKYQTKIKNDDRFMQVDEFMNNLSFTTEEKEYMIQKGAYAYGGYRDNDIINQKLAIMVKRVSSKKIRAMINDVMRPKKELDIPRNLYWDMQDQLKDEIKERNDKADMLGKYLKRRYPKFKNNDDLDYINRVNKTYLQGRF